MRVVPHTRLLDPVALFHLRVFGSRRLVPALRVLVGTLPPKPVVLGLEWPPFYPDRTELRSLLVGRSGRSVCVFSTRPSSLCPAIFLLSPGFLGGVHAVGHSDT